MTDYKGILRLSALGIAKQDIDAACKCSRNTVRNVLNAADKSELSWGTAKSHSNEQLKALLFPTAGTSPLFKMPDYEYVHREMQKSGVTLSLLWVEYCEKCRQNQEIPYKSTQFNKYYADYVHKTKATMHLEYKPGDTMQVDWVGQTARIIDTYTSEDIDVYIFVSVLAHSGYAYVEGFLDMKQESWITAHVNAYHFYEGVTRILTPDNLKTGIIKNTREGVEVNRSYLEMAEHYGTAVIPARPRSPKDKALVENSIGGFSTWILAVLRSSQFFTLQDYKSCMILLKQADKYSPQRLEAACKKALSFSPMPSLKSVQSILKSGLDKLLDPETTSSPPEIPKYGFTRGADYYRRDEQC